VSRAQERLMKCCWVWSYKRGISYMCRDRARTWS